MSSDQPNGSPSRVPVLEPAVELAPVAEAGPVASRRLDLGSLDGMLGYHLRRAQVATFQSFAEHVRQPDITPGRFGVLALIRANPGLNQTELANTLGIDRSTMVALIDHLERRGAVVRKPSPFDRRTYALHLTPEGEQLFAELHARINQHEQAIAARLNPDERAQLVALLRRVAVGS